MEEIFKMWQDFSKSRIKITEEELLKEILVFLKERREEFLKRIRRKESDEILRKWLESPVQIESIDSLNEHDSLI